MDKPDLPVLSEIDRRGKTALVLGVVALLFLSGFLVYSQPSQSPSADTNTESQQSIEPSENNSALYHALSDATIRDAVVDITEERAFVRYNVPAGMSKNESIYYTLGAAAAVASSSDRVVLEVYTNYEPNERVVVDMEAATAFRDNRTTAREFRNEIRRTELQTDS